MDRTRRPLAPSPGPALPYLTERETEVVNLLTQGYSNKEIASRLFISPHTAKTHLGQIFRKCGVRNRVELTGWWVSCAKEATQAMATEAEVEPTVRRSNQGLRPRKKLTAFGLAGAVAAITISLVILRGGWPLPDVGALAGGGSPAPAAGLADDGVVCEVGPTGVTWWPTLEERAVVLPDGSTATMTMQGNARSLTLPGYTAKAELMGYADDGSPVYGCPPRYNLNSESLEAMWEQGLTKFP